MTENTSSSSIDTAERTRPLSDLDRLLESVRGRVFNALGLHPWTFVEFDDGTPVLRAARADISDTGTAFKIVAEIPGIPKDRLDIRVRGTNVQIRAEQNEETKNDGKEYLYRERTFQGFFRDFELPEPVIASKATAKFENGLLELELPKEHPTSEPAEVKVPVA
ncbi:MAG: Hsp20/alpha crystallin family protein [Thermoplasmata archaeon]|nr:Hsp20/alpha crystallin family protein [Thermoplasmata archaeon]